MLDPLWSGDLIAGLAAIAVFLGLFVLLGVTPIASVPLAALAYFGIRLSLPRSDGLAATIRACQRQVDDITHALGTVDSRKRPAGADDIRQIVVTLAAILSAIKSDSKKRGYAPAFLDDYLSPIGAVVTPYVRLAGQDVTLANPDLKTTESETFPQILAELTKLREDLYRSDVTQLRTGKELVDLISLPIVTSHKDESP